MNGARPLNGYRVVELGEGVSAPFCARTLAGLGADVIKVEPPDGERARRAREPSRRHDDVDPAYLEMNIGKRGIVLDLEHAADRARFLDLVGTADVVVENQPVGRLAALGLDPGSLIERQPRLVIGSISPFGQTGPMAGWRARELNAAATGGYVLSVGLPDREPLEVPPNSIEALAGLHAAAAIVTGLFDRDRSGRGHRIDIAVAEVAACVFEGTAVAVYVKQGHRTRRAGYRSSRSFPHAILPCADGYVAVHAGQSDMWQRLVELTGDPTWRTDPRFQRRATIGRSYADEAYDLLNTWLGRHTRAELLAIGIDHHVPLGPVRTLDEVLEDPQLAHRGAFVELDHPEVGPLRYFGLPFGPDFPWGFDRPAPTLGEHTDEVLLEVRPRPSGRHLPDAPGEADRLRLPLAGIRVMDFGHIVAGPMIGGFLADLGAEVIKVESRRHLDTMRKRVVVGRPLGEGDGLETEASAQFQGLNRGKLSLTVDFKDERGRRLLLRLAAVTDIVIDNFSAGVLQRVGLDHDALMSVNPDIIQLSLSGAGQTGPIAGLVAFAPVMTALSGHSSLVGYPGERPLNIGPFGDSVAAANGLVAILSALAARERTGQGAVIDLSAYAATTALLGESLLRYQLTGAVPTTLGNTHPVHSPQGIFPCERQEDREAWIAIVVTDEDEWLRFAGRIGPTWLDDPRFGSAADRRANRAVLDAEIGTMTRRHERDELVADLQGLGVAATPVHDIDEMVAHEQWRGRRTFPTVQHPRLGPIEVARVPWGFDGIDLAPRAAAPLLGQHTETICRTVLGMSQTEIDEVATALV